MFCLIVGSEAQVRRRSAASATRTLRGANDQTHRGQEQDRGRSKKGKMQYLYDY